MRRIISLDNSWVKYWCALRFTFPTFSDIYLALGLKYVDVNVERYSSSRSFSVVVTRVFFNNDRVTSQVMCICKNREKRAQRERRVEWQRLKNVPDPENKHVVIEAHQASSPASIENFAFFVSFFLVLVLVFALVFFFDSFK